MDKKAAENGVPVALHRGGYGFARNGAEAAKWYRLAADQGLAEAQFNLGVMYYR